MKRKQDRLIGMAHPQEARTADPERMLGLAMRRGAMGRCPNCGEALHHQRADDGPAYVTILIVSHVAAAVMLSVYTIYRPSSEVMIAIFLGGSLLASLILLPIIKGAFVGLQWAKRMRGFGHGGEDRPNEP